MTDQTPAAPNAAPTGADAVNGQQTPQGPYFRALAQYVRDLSFENPRAPESLRIEGKPNVDLGVEMAAQGRADGLFEVDLKLSVKASQGDVAMFQVELLYGGLFQIGGVSEADLEPLLMIECPRFLFPYARQIISACTADGGFFPPFMIDPLDFASIYMARKAQAQGADIQGPGAPAKKAKKAPAAKA